MAKAVQELPQNIQQYIEVYEWDMRTLEGLSRFSALKGKVLPSIALDEKLVYESIIPDQEVLGTEIIRIWQQKNSAGKP